MRAERMAAVALLTASLLAGCAPGPELPEPTPFETPKPVEAKETFEIIKEALDYVVKHGMLPRELAGRTIEPDVIGDAENILGVGRVVNQDLESETLVLLRVGSPDYTIKFLQPGDTEVYQREGLSLQIVEAPKGGSLKYIPNGVVMGYDQEGKPEFLCTGTSSRKIPLPEGVPSDIIIGSSHHRYVIMHDNSPLYYLNPETAMWESYFNPEENGFWNRSEVQQGEDDLVTHLRRWQGEGKIDPNADPELVAFIYHAEDPTKTEFRMILRLEDGSLVVALDPELSTRSGVMGVIPGEISVDPTILTIRDANSVSPDNEVRFLDFDWSIRAPVGRNSSGEVVVWFNLRSFDEESQEYRPAWNPINPAYTAMQDYNRERWNNE